MPAEGDGEAGIDGGGAKSRQCRKLAWKIRILSRKHRGRSSWALPKNWEPRAWSGVDATETHTHIPRSRLCSSSLSVLLNGCASLTELGDTRPVKSHHLLRDSHCGDRDKQAEARRACRRRRRGHGRAGRAHASLSGKVFFRDPGGQGWGCSGGWASRARDHGGER